MRARIAATLARGPSGTGGQVHSDGQRQRSIAAAAVGAAVPVGRVAARKRERTSVAEPEASAPGKASVFDSCVRWYAPI